MMVLLELEWGYIVIAAVIAYVVSALWYAPILFGNMTPKKQKEAGGTNVAVVIAMQLVTILFLTILTGMMIEAYDVLSGFIAVALTLTAMKLSSALFVGQSTWMTLVNIGYRIAMVGIISLTYWIGALLGY